MKRFIFLLISLSLFFTGCNMDETVLPETDGDLKSAELKMVPIKGEMQSTVTVYDQGIPVQGTLSGVLSHLGKLNAEESVFYTVSLDFDPTTYTITWGMSGVVCAADGDLLNYLLNGTFLILTNELTGQAEYNGGTGRFEHAKGFMNFIGYADDPMAITTMFMTGEGMISNVGSSK